MTVLVIAGHGWQRDKSFDPGAGGYITKGEYKYMVEDLFPAMKKYLSKNSKVVFYSAKKVSNHGNLVQLVKQYNAKSVVEFHYDAHTMGSSARGGHVIVHSGRNPNKLDLAIRDAIDSMVGTRYTHKGQKGISGRNNLYNVNQASRNDIDYRLVELGFGTNKTDADIMTKRVDEYAKKLVEAITGSSSSGVSKTNTTTKSKLEPTTSNTPTIKQGSKGSAVKKAQQSLVSKGYSVGRAGADGIFGKDTDTAVRQLQKDAKITVDGIVGRDTWRILNSNFKKPSATKSTGGYKVGQKVRIKSTAKTYSRANANIPSQHKNKTYTIQQVGKNDVLIKELYSWVKMSDLQSGASGTSKTTTKKSKSSPKRTYKVGQKVKIKSSAKTYATGERIPTRVKNKTYTIQQIGSGRVLIKELYSWVRHSDLQ